MDSVPPHLVEGLHLDAGVGMRVPQTGNQLCPVAVGLEGGAELIRDHDE